MSDFVVDKETINCWRINYGIAKYGPKGAADWWREQNGNFELAAPAAAVAALGHALDALEQARAALERIGAGFCACRPPDKCGPCVARAALPETEEDSHE